MIEQKQKSLTYLQPEKCPRCRSNKIIEVKTLEWIGRFDLLALLCMKCDNDFYGVRWKFYDRSLTNPWLKYEA